MGEDVKGKTVSELAAFLAEPFSGDGETIVQRLSALESAEPGSLSFVENQKALEEVKTCAAACVIVVDAEGARKALPQVAAFIESAQPKLAFSKVAPFL